MRERIRQLAGAKIPEHFGLAYDVYAPVGSDGKVPDGSRDDWFKSFEKIAVPEGYRDRVKGLVQGFAQQGIRYEILRLESRLLIGHGNAAPTEVGLTVHRTWGVPFIPGSALKGLLAHYVETTYGPDRLAEGRPHSLDPALSGEERRRAEYQGPTYRKGGIEHGPGAIYRVLFGAPAARSDEKFSSEAPDLVGDSRGGIEFLDALFVPEPPAQGGVDTEDLLPFAPDVITVHQRGYYGGGGESWPNDYDSPNPVGFVTIKPGAMFLVAIGGDRSWADLGMDLLLDALGEWGVGGKTASGYGRLSRVDLPDWVRPPKPEVRSVLIDEFGSWIETHAETPEKERLGILKADWQERFSAASAEESEELKKRIRAFVKKDRFKAEREDFIKSLWPQPGN